MKNNSIKRLDGNEMKSIKTINIWNEINENTERIMITNENHKSQFLQIFTHSIKKTSHLTKGQYIEKYGHFIRDKDERYRNRIIKLEPPECVVINFFGHPELKIENLEGMPQNLPNLEKFEIRNCKIKSLKGIPKNLPNLKELILVKLGLKNLSEMPKYLPNLKKLHVFSLDFKNLSSLPRNLLNLKILGIGDFNLKDLTGIPQNFPNIELLGIRDFKNLSGMPQNFPILKSLKITGESFESLKGIPNSFPKLEKLYISNTSIQNLEYFPTATPNLKEINLVRNNLVSLKGLPSHIPVLKKLNLSFNQLTSLEDLPYQFDDIQRQFGVKKRTPLIDYHNNPIRTFAGIKYHRKSKNMHIPDFRYYSNFQLCPTFLNLIKKYDKIKAEYSLRSSKYQEREECNAGFIQYLSHLYDYVEIPTAEDFKRYKKEISALKAAIIEYYHKTPMKLAQQYVETPDVLTEGELERLGWEGGYQERQLLESNFPHDNPVLKEISKRLTHQLPSGLSILK